MSPNLLRQQDGQDRCGLLLLGSHDGERLGANAVPIQLPVGAEADFEGVVDLVEMNAKVWRGETKLGETYDTVEIPADLAEQAEEYRTKLLEVVAESDEHLLEKYLGGEELTVDEIKGAIRKLTIASEIYPVLCGSAFKNKGVQPMLDAVVDYLPSPLDVPPAIGHAPAKEDEEVVRKATTDEPFAALAFKIATHPFFGKLTYIRVYWAPSSRVARSSMPPRARKNGWASCSRCTPTRRTRSIGLVPVTSTR